MHGTTHGCPQWLPVLTRGPSGCSLRFESEARVIVYCLAPEDG
jgi:hypothetical protein